MSEHESVCILSKSVAEKLAGEKKEDGEESEEILINRFSSTVDETLRRLDQFVNIDMNHHPKLYFWSPGLAACILAATTGFDMTWLTERCERLETGYERLPISFLTNPLD